MQIAIGTGLLRLEPFSAAQEGGGMCQGQWGWTFLGCATACPWRCHSCRHSTEGAGTTRAPLDRAAPLPVVLISFTMEGQRNSQKCGTINPVERRERKGSGLLLSQPGLGLFFWKEDFRVFSWLCPGRLTRFAASSPTQIHYSIWRKLGSSRRKTPWCLSSLDVVFGITHPALPELLTWGFNHDESSQTSLGFEEKN